MKGIFQFGFILSLCISFAMPIYSQNKMNKREAVSDVKEIFETANALMAEKNYAEALNFYKKGLKLIPEAHGLLYNGGLAAFQCEEYEQALKFWKKLKNLNPDDWQVRAKLIQTYQALGKFVNRDEEREELFDLKKSRRVVGLNNAEFYIREQTELVGRRVMVSEYFELRGEEAVRYIFSVLDEKEQPVYKISLGSYAATDRLWQELDGADQRAFHLDGYFKDGSHETYQVYREEPTYDEVRKAVKKILEKKAKTKRLP